MIAVREELRLVCNENFRFAQEERASDGVEKQFIADVCVDSRQLQLNR